LPSIFGSKGKLMGGQKKRSQDLSMAIEKEML